MKQEYHAAPVSGGNPGLDQPRRVLMIAFHFPPLAGSSGIQRTLRFVQHLPTHGWQPLVLTAHPRAYERTSTDLFDDIPAGTPVERAFALDSARHLTLGGRYLGFTARPDRWMTWRFDAVRVGMAMIRRYRPQVIWSTYPIATAHVIGRLLHARSGLPWVADFRDPMAQEGYPSDARTWQAYHDIESQTLALAACSVFTTPGAADEYRGRYPASSERIRLVENGYDESTFTEAELEQPQPASLNPGALTLLHSGIVYPDERDPTALMAALGRLFRRGEFAGRDLKIRFRASVHDELIRKLAAQHGVQSMVETLPPIGYREALQEMRGADGLLVLQSSGCNAQVPAKVYEYLRADRPILLLSDRAGDTSRVLSDAGLTDVAALDSADEIEAALDRFVSDLLAGRARRPQPAAVRRASREHRAGEFATILDRVSSGTADLPVAGLASATSTRSWP